MNWFIFGFVVSMFWLGFIIGWSIRGQEIKEKKGQP